MISSEAISASSDLVARGPRRHALDETTHVEEFDKAR
jgi:hypothetical protein